MKLGEAQKIFTLNIAQLIIIMFKHGFTCTLGEAWRPPEMAEIYEKQGKGIKNSLHSMRLALDINLFSGKKYLTSSASHKVFGDIWKSLHPNNEWGGDFKRQDGNHYQMSLKERR